MTYTPRVCAYTRHCKEDGGFHGVCDHHRAMLYPGGVVPPARNQPDMKDKL